RSVSDYWVEDAGNDSVPARASRAERIVLDALKYDPTNVARWDVILDIKYDTTVVYKLLAAESIVRARVAALGPEAGGPLPINPANERVIDTEINTLQDAIPRYTRALNEYFKLFTDPLGVDTRRIDS